MRLAGQFSVGVNSTDYRPKADYRAIEFNAQQQTFNEAAMLRKPK